MEKPSRKLRQNAENCAEQAEIAGSPHEKARFKRMEKAWGNLADSQEWLEGEKSELPKRRE